MASEPKMAGDDLPGSEGNGKGSRLQDAIDRSDCRMTPFFAKKTSASSIVAAEVKGFSTEKGNVHGREEENATR